jgi:nucleoid-associated protein Lsr2
MAQKVRVTYADDLDGDEFESEHPTYRFGFEGREYEIDLKPANGKKLEQVLAKYIEHARRAKAGAPLRRKGSVARDRQRPAEIREWARTRGIEVSERGRIPSNVIRQYEESVR